MCTHPLLFFPELSTCSRILKKIILCSFIGVIQYLLVLYLTTSISLFKFKTGYNNKTISNVSDATSLLTKNSNFTIVSAHYDFVRRSGFEILSEIKKGSLTLPQITELLSKNPNIVSNISLTL